MLLLLLPLRACFVLLLLGCECLFVCLFWPSFASGSQLTVEIKLLISTLNKDTLLLIRKFNKRTDGADERTDSMANKRMGERATIMIICFVL